MLKKISCPNPQRQTGTTLIEVLITLLILSIGLMGLAGLQLAAQQMVMESYQRDQALAIAQDMVQRINANRQYVACYATTSYFGTNAAGTGYVAANTCAGNAQAVSDMTDWSQLLYGATESGNTGAMIGARGCISYSSTTKIAVVTVAWQGLMDTAAPPSGLSCGSGLYSSETKRRVISFPLQIATLT